MKRQTISILAFLVLFAAAGPAPARAECSDAKSRQFDFWAGEWEVSANGKPAGHNSIRPILDGCVLQETWAGAQGSAGSSFNFYDPQRKKWRQLWVWRNGTTLELEGELRDGSMVLEGRSKDQKGNPVHNRITWTPNEDGTVRQHWQVRGADADEWKTAFDGLYKKKS
ncbi:MAG: hypothetical protein GY716_09930 [bacterium]|nr:hypothetical protein [bacterium]